MYPQSKRYAYPVRCVRTPGVNAMATRNVTVTNYGLGIGTVSINDTAYPLENGPALVPIVTGQRVKVSFAPEAGWQFAGWTGNISGSGSVVFENPNANPAYFTMPDGNVSILPNIINVPDYLVCPAGEFEVPATAREGVPATIWAGANVEEKRGGMEFADLMDYTGSMFQWGRVATGVSYMNAPSAAGTDQTSVTTWPAATDPCPEGWRVPSPEEYRALKAFRDYYLNDYGALIYFQGPQDNPFGFQGHYWTNAQSGGTGYSLYFEDQDRGNFYYDVTHEIGVQYALPVRCVRTPGGNPIQY